MGKARSNKLAMVGAGTEPAPRVKWMRRWMHLEQAYGQVVHIDPPAQDEETRERTAAMTREMVRDNIEDSLPPEMRIRTQTAEKWADGVFYMAWLYPGKPGTGRTAEGMIEEFIKAREDEA